MSIYRADWGWELASWGAVLCILYRGGGGTLGSRPARVVCVTSPVTLTPTLASTPAPIVDI